jgi:predicted AAA+ superfamily ATPase
MIKREAYLKKIRPYYEVDLIKVLIGVRRCGKSVVLEQIYEEISKTNEKANCIHINFENYQFKELTNPDKLYEYLSKQVDRKKKNYIFVDEIQEVDDFERVINSINIEYNCSIFITGSNAHLLAGEMSTYLSGRTLEFNIYPFNFQEVLDITNSENYEEAFNDFLIWGGMPRRFVFNEPEEIEKYLSDLYSTIILRDIIQRSKIRDIDTLEKIINYLNSNIGNTFSINSIRNYLNSQLKKVAPETLYNYIYNILGSCMYTKAKRYDLKGKQILETFEKYYVCDIGLSNINNSNSSLDLGYRFENIVYTELLSRDYKVSIGKNQSQEIDFIATKGKEKLYIQACYKLDSDATIEREFSAFKNVNDGTRRMVISNDKFDFSRDGIQHLNIIDWLLNKK